MLHLFIVNPIAGKADATAYLVPKLRETLSSLSIDAKIVYTRYAGHGTAIAREYARRGEPVRLYACGGDGTLNEIIAGAFGYPNVQVAPVPCGSGNDFIKSFGNQQDFLNILALIEGEPVTIDLMEADGRVAVNICSVGLDAQVAYGASRFRRVPFCGGSMAYHLSVLESLGSHLGHHLTIQVDDEVFQGEYLLACMANGQYYGGGYRSTPLASLNDGLLDVVLVKKVSRLKIASIIARYKAGTHFVEQQIDPRLSQWVTFRRASQVSIRSEYDFIANLDGECGPRHTFSVRILPQAGCLVLPKPLAARYRQQTINSLVVE